MKLMYAALMRARQVRKADDFRHLPKQSIGVPVREIAFCRSTSVIVLFTLVAHCKHDNFRRADDLIQRHIPGASERDDQFPLGYVLGRFAKAEGRDSQPVLRRRLDGVDRGLGAIEVFGCLGSIKQEFKEALQVSFCCRGEPNDKAHRPSRLRLASSLDCSLFRTVSTGTETPVRWYSSDAACARAWNEVWTRRNAMAFRTVASTKSVKVSPGWRTDSSSARNAGSTRI